MELELEESLNIYQKQLTGKAELRLFQAWRT